MRRRQLHCLAVASVALALRLGGLGRESLTMNEATTAALAQDPWGDVIHKTAHDVHPPLHYLFVNTWSAVFGTGDIALRLPSVLSGVLAVVVTWWWAARFLSPGAALVAGLFVSLSPFHIHYSQEARFYGFLGLGAAVWWVALAHLLWRPAWRWWVVALLAGLIGLYTHYYFGFLALALWGVGTIRAVVGPSPRHSVRLWLALAAGLTAGFAPWIGIMLRHFAGPGAGSTGPVTLGIVQHTIRYFASYGPDTQPWRGLSLLLLAVIVLGGLGRWRWLRDHLGLFPPVNPGEFLPAIGVVATCALVFFTCKVKPLYIAKGMVIILPGYAFLAALVWHRITGRWARILLALVFGLTVCRALVVFYRVPRNDDWRGVAQLIADEGRPGDIVCLKEGAIFLPFHHYYHADAPERRLPEVQLHTFPDTTDLVIRNAPSPLGPLPVTSDTLEVEGLTPQLEALGAACEGAARLWLVRGHTRDSRVRDALLGETERLNRLRTWGFRGVEVFLFAIRQAQTGMIQ